MNFRAASVSRGEQHAGQHQLLDRVGVGAGRVEDRDATCRHLRNGKPRPGPTDGEHGGRDLGAVQVGRAKENGGARGPSAETTNWSQGKRFSPLAEMWLRN